MTLAPRAPRNGWARPRDGRLPGPTLRRRRWPRSSTPRAPPDGGRASCCRTLGLFGAPEEIIASEPIRALALARIKQAVAHFPAYATPRKVWLTLEPWTIAAALMTPTLKLKRKGIEETFAREIASLYTK